MTIKKLLLLLTVIWFVVALAALSKAEIVWPDKDAKRDPVNYYIEKIEPVYVRVQSADSIPLFRQQIDTIMARWMVYTVGKLNVRLTVDEAVAVWKFLQVRAILPPGINRDSAITAAIKGQ